MVFIDLIQKRTEEEVKELRVRSYYVVIFAVV